MSRRALILAVPLMLAAVPSQAGSAWDRDARPSFRTYERATVSRYGATEGPLVDGQVVERRTRAVPHASYGFARDDYGRPSVVVRQEIITVLDPYGTGREPVLEVPPSVVSYAFDYYPTRSFEMPGSLSNGFVLPPNIYLTNVPHHRAYGYAVVNGQMIITQRGSRTVVYVEE